MSLEVIPVACLSDNFAYVLVCGQSGQVAVVDPSEAEPVKHTLSERGLALNHIFNTHHHWDHVGGNKDLVAAFPGVEVWGHASDKGRIPCQTKFLEEGDPVPFGALQGHILHNPGHTSGAISFVFGDCAFTGDTLFRAGCGRLFEGTPAQMDVSLNRKIGGLPADTKLYFGHEYTLANLTFAQSVEPRNRDISEAMARAVEDRDAGRFTTPSTVAEERRINPFMRVDQPDVIAAAQKAEPGLGADSSSVLGAIRRMKDHF